LLLLPGILWFALFNLYAYVPYSNRPKIDITTLPELESRLLFGNSLQFWPRNHIIDKADALVDFLDLLSAFVYVIHFLFVWIFAILLYLYYRKKRDAHGHPIVNPWTFFWCWGFLNFYAVVTQLCWPTAPPWYLETYGNQQPSYNISGDPAGLDNADTLLHVPLFESVYGNSPIVFGSFPSLHGAWPIMITIFMPGYRALKAVGVLYAVLVWWAAMYLNHHYLVDLIGGAIYVAFSYSFGMLTIRFLFSKFHDNMYGRRTLLGFSKRGRGDPRDYELLAVATEPSGISPLETPTSPRMIKFKEKDKDMDKDSNSSTAPLLALGESL